MENCSPFHRFLIPRFTTTPIKMTQQCTLGAPESQQYSGLHQKKHGQQSEGHSAALYSVLARPPFKYCIHVWGPQHRKDTDMLE